MMWLTNMQRSCSQKMEPNIYSSPKMEMMSAKKKLTIHSQCRCNATLMVREVILLSIYLTLPKINATQPSFSLTEADAQSSLQLLLLSGSRATHGLSLS